MFNYVKISNYSEECSTMLRYKKQAIMMGKSIWIKRYEECSTMLRYQINYPEECSTMLRYQINYPEDCSTKLRDQTMIMQNVQLS